MRVLTSLCLAVTLGCGGDTEAPPPREVSLDGTVDATGFSEELVFGIPESSRSITIVVEGAPDALYALGELGLGDGVDLVELD
nr:hypothetical protein [Deltaproteobacteria bacterium]